MRAERERVAQCRPTATHVHVDDANRVARNSNKRHGVASLALISDAQQKTKTLIVASEIDNR